jgi:hypothetical protein
LDACNQPLARGIVEDGASGDAEEKGTHATKEGEAPRIRGSVSTDDRGWIGAAGVLLQPVCLKYVRWTVESISPTSGSTIDEPIVLVTITGAMELTTMLECRHEEEVRVYELDNQGGRTDVGYGWGGAGEGSLFGQEVAARDGVSHSPTWMSR